MTNTVVGNATLGDTLFCRRSVTKQENTMNKDATFELNGEFYLWSDGNWLDAKTRVSASGVIQRELNRRYGYRVGMEAAVQKRTPKTKVEPGSSKNKDIQKTIGPIMIAFIHRRYAVTHDFVHGSEIAAYLLDQPEAVAFLRQTYAQTRQLKTFEDYVGNQVSWLGANLDDPSRSEYDDLIEKIDMPDGKLGFRPKWPFGEGEVWDRDVVVQVVKERLTETGQKKREGKEANLEVIAQGPKSIRFMPHSEGWGRSPMNARCWADAVTGERLK